MSKTQSVTNLYSVGMPKELILKYTNLSLDPCADAKKWQDEVDLQEQTDLKVLEQDFNTYNDGNSITETANEDV